MFNRTSLIAVAAMATFAVTVAATASTEDGPSVQDACVALDLRACTVQQLHLEPLGNGDQGLELAIDERARSWHFQLHSNRGAEYRVLVQVAGGGFVEQEPGLLSTYRGVDVFDLDTTAALSIADDGFRVQFRDSDGSIWFAEPLIGRARGAGPDHYAVYPGEDIISPDAVCGVDETWRVFEHESGGQVNGLVNRGGDVLMAEMAVDADYEFYSIYGSVSAVENRVNAVINAVNNQYESEVGLTHELQAIVVRSTNNDPYNTNNIETRLYQLQADWNSGNHPGIPRDVVHLFSGVDFDGNTIGLAFLNAVCSSYEYGVVQDYGSGSFGCTTDLSAHELGHNWGSGHCNCSGYTMNPIITCGNQFTTQSESSIISYSNSIEGCLSDPSDPTGACCYNGECDVLWPDKCAAIGGEYYGDGVNCGSVNCPDATGACCYNGGCLILTNADCIALGGQYYGNGVNCGSVNCPGATGACCYDGGCFILTNADCVAKEGEYYGDGVNCGSVDCPDPTGACCNNGGCSILTNADCLAAGGKYLGNESDCGNDVCDVQTWTVDDDGPADFDNIQAAVYAASNWDEIVVEPGTYTSTEDGYVVNMLGKAITLRSSEGAAVTIIDGEGTRGVLLCTGNETSATVIEGFTITGGQATVGGGINFEESHPTVTDCMIEGNSALNYGGGIYFGADSNASIANCTISGNTATWGAGIYCNASDPMLTACTLNGNTATNYGGGVYCGSSSEPMLTDCTINGNTASWGAGVYCFFSDPELNGCTIDSNTADIDGGGGGGMYCNSSSDPAVTNCVISNNAATWGGGIESRNNSDPAVSYTTVCGNTPDQVNGNWSDEGGNDIAAECPSTCPDINGDGVVGVDEILAIIAAWETDDADADLNDDGTVDTNDILLVLSAWGPCP